MGVFDARVLRRAPTKDPLFLLCEHPDPEVHERAERSSHRGMHLHLLVESLNPGVLRLGFQ